MTRGVDVWVIAGGRYWHVTPEQYRELLRLWALEDRPGAAEIGARFDIQPRAMRHVPERYRYRVGSISGAPYDLDAMTPDQARHYRREYDLRTS